MHSPLLTEAHLGNVDYLPCHYASCKVTVITGDQTAAWQESKQRVGRAARSGDGQRGKG